MNLAFSVAEEAFRAELRAWLGANRPPAKSTIDTPHFVGGASGSPVTLMNPA